MPGATYNFPALRALWIAAGGAGRWADTMAAIALAESSGCRYALAGPKDVRPVKLCTYRQTTGENSVGLWQINVQAHPQYDVFALFDPMDNARAAVAVLGSGSPTPWSTYTSGAYRAYMPTPGGTPAGPVGPVGRVTPSVFAGLQGPVGVGPTPRTNNVFIAWKHLTHSVGVTMPTQAKRARLSRNAFGRAIRYRALR